MTYIVDKPVLYSELSAHGETREKIARRLLERCNKLGRMRFVEVDYTETLATEFLDEEKELAVAAEKEI